MPYPHDRHRGWRKPSVSSAHVFNYGACTDQPKKEPTKAGSWTKYAETLAFIGSRCFD
jgi:hypothetical protein